MNRSFVLLFVLCVALPLASLAQKDKPEGAKKDHPAQASVAIKKPFATIPAKDPALTKATEAKDLATVKKLVNKEAALKGTVDKVFASRGNSIVILNFAKNYKDAASVVLKPENYAKFPNMETLKDKTILVTGKVNLFREQPQIELTKPDQLKIVQ